MEEKGIEEKILQKLTKIEERLTAIEIKADKMMTLARGLADKI